MDAKTLTGAKRMTRKEFWAESDRLLKEAQGFLEEARRSTERSRQLAEKNERSMEELERRVTFQKKLNRS